MNNEELLRELSVRVSQGLIQPSEVAARLSLPVSPTAGKERPRFSITKILYILGGSVAALGIIFFIAQIWDDIGSIGRITTTLLFGLILAGAGSLLLKAKPESRLGEVFHAIGGLLIPGGALVTLNEIGADINSLWPVTIVIGIVALFYLLLDLYHRNVVLTFFAIANSTATVYLLIEAVLPGRFYQHEDMMAYLTMAVGLSYLLLAYAFRGGWNRHLVGLLNFFGSAGFLGAAFTRVFDSGFWEFAFFLCTVGGMAAAVYIRSRAILVTSTFFLIAHFIYITNEYFADSIGWPISLVVLGFLFIGLGYVSITINRRYIKPGAAA